MTGERWTARTNTTRKEVTWEAETPVTKEVANRRVYADLTFSVQKSISVYLAKTGDQVRLSSAKLVRRPRRAITDHEKQPGPTRAQWRFVPGKSDRRTHFDPRERVPDGSHEARARSAGIQRDVAGVTEP